MRDHLPAARELAAEGYRVMPVHTMQGTRCDCGGRDCASPAKHPRIQNWPVEATTDVEMVERWWRTWPAANIGIATGADSGYIVIDIDPRHGGDEELKRLTDAHGLFEPGPAAATGGGGWHYYFAHPGGKILSRTVAPGIDVKGDGGQVVAPPSFHASGRQYEWAVGPDYPLPTVPDWLLLLIKADHDDGMEGRAKPVVGVIPSGERNKTLASLGGSMRRRGFGEAAIFGALMTENGERCVPPLDRAAVAQIAASVARYAPEEGIIVSGAPAAAPPTKRPAPAPETISARTLQHKVFTPPRMAVPGLMPVGLCLLAGRLKLGKSWMMLGVSLAIAEGGIALGSVPVEDGDVLYVAFEDHARRLQGRMKTLLENVQQWPERLEVSPSGCWPKREEGGLLAIDAWLGAHPDARMVIIDTLQRFRGGSAGEGDKNAYAADYGVSAELQELAMKHEVVIVAVHHYRKSISDVDWVDQISGTNGIAGAADTVLGFERERGSKEAILRATGRDIEDAELALLFDPLRYGWYISGTAEEVRLTAAAQEMTEAMWKIGRGQSVHYHKIAEVVGKKRNTVYKMLERLSAKGILISHGNGLYGAVGVGGVKIVHGEANSDVDIGGE